HPGRPRRAGGGGRRQRPGRLQPQAAGPGRQRRHRRAQRPGGGRVPGLRRRPDGRLHQAHLRQAGRRAGGRGRGRAGGPPQGGPERGQARGGLAQDPRGQAQRLVQALPGRCAPGAALLRAGREAERREGPGRRHHRHLRPGDDRLSSRMPAPWKRVVLKLSGEAFASSASDETIDGGVVERIATEVAEARGRLDVEMAVVIGGGNIWRGTKGAGAGMDRATADYMGMLATVINGLALQDALERLGQPTRVQTAIQMAEIAEPYIRRRAIRHLEKGRVVVFVAGTGTPFFTTDTTASLRGAEIEAEAILKGTHVDGVYDDDPRTNPDAN